MFQREVGRVRSRLGLLAVTLAMAAGVLSVVPVASGAAGHAVAPKATAKQWGVDLWVGYNCEPTSTWEAWGTKIFQQVKALHANSVGFVIPFYTDSHTANTFYAKQVCNSPYSTPTPVQVAQLVVLAHAAGLKVFLRPDLAPQNLSTVNFLYWSGNIAPTSPRTWFRNYYTTLKPYLSMSQQYRVEHFAISTELSSMAQYSSLWNLTVSLARSTYKGELVFTPTWTNTPNKFHAAGTSTGVDMYPYLSQLRTNATVSQIVAAWTMQLKKYPIPGKLSSWTDDETGIPAQDGAYAKPNLLHILPTSQHPFNQTIQVNWFKAACTWVKNHKLGGIYFNVVPIYEGGLLTSPNPSEPAEIQPQAQAAIKSCFA